MSFKKLSIIVCTIAMTLLLTPLSFAANSANDIDQSDQSKVANQKETETIYRDILRRDTPRGTVEGFLSAVELRDYALAAEYFNLENLSTNKAKNQGAVLARKLRIVIDQNILIDPANINNTYDGQLDDNLPTWQEIIGVIKTNEKTYDLFLEKTISDKGISIWLFSDRTIKEITEMFDYFGLGILGKYLPKSLFEYTLFRITFAEWFSFIVLSLVLFSAIYLLSQLFYMMVKKLNLTKLEPFFKLMLWPTRILLLAFLVRDIFQEIAFSEAARSLIKANTGPIIAVIWFLLRLCEYFFEHWCQKLRSSNQNAKAVLVTLVQKIVLIIIIFGGVAIYLENLGFQITSIIAGLGVGGIAVALASQKSLEDFFGAVTILGSSPIKAGDFISLEGGRLGTVEEIGMRFTKIRTLERTVLNIPNSKISSMTLENLTKRDRFFYNPDIGLRLDTTPSQVRYVLLEAKKVFYSHPKIHFDTARIRLKEFSSYAMILALYLHIKADNYAESLAISEDINFRIMDILEKAGVQMAYPTQTVIRETPTLPDTEKAQVIEKKVKSLREQGELFITDFPYEEIKKIHNTLKYPFDAKDCNQST